MTNHGVLCWIVFFFFKLLFDWLVQTLISMLPKCAAWITTTTDEQARVKLSVGF